MKATHIMNIDGVWYNAGDEIDTSAIKADVSKENTSKPKYTRGMISQMTVDVLREVAAAEGFSDVQTASGSRLKRELIEHFGL